MPLEIENLTVKINDKTVLNDITLSILEGKVKVLMGPNGGGKSSLAYAIMGREGYKIVSGDIKLDGKGILDLDTYERSRLGIFLSIQEPPPIPGIKLSSFIEAIYKKVKRINDVKRIIQLYEKINLVGLSREYLNREINLGFSGGEKKRLELYQAIISDPEIIILDEPDSGLDVDGVKIVVDIIEDMKRRGKAILLITHNPRLLHYLIPDEILILISGRIVEKGGLELARAVESNGYEIFINGV